MSNLFRYPLSEKRNKNPGGTTMKNNNMRIRKIWLSSADEEFEKKYRFALISDKGYRIVMNGERTTRHDVYDFWRGNHRLSASEQRWYQYAFVIEGSFTEDGKITAAIYKKDYKIDGEMSHHKSWPSYMKQIDVTGPRMRVATLILDHEKEASIEVLVDTEVMELEWLCDECTACMEEYGSSSLVEFYRKVLSEIRWNYYCDFYDQEDCIPYREYLNERK